MKVTGKVEFRDLEGGVWLLAADDGQLYQLAGGDRGLKRDGARVEAEGQVDAGAVSLGMAGPVFHVRSYVFL